MTRAGKACRKPDCPNLEPCPDHPRIPWAGSNRRERTVSGWEQQRRAARILERDAYVCHVCGKTGADQADHVVPLADGGADDDANLAAIHAAPCHRDKTIREANSF